MKTIYEPKGRALEYSLLALNHYNGCEHGCSYCYARDMAERWGKPFAVASPRSGVVAALRKEAPSFAGTDKRVLLSFSTDPYQAANDRFGLTRQVLTVLRDHDIPWQILTKGGLRAVADFDLYGRRDAFATTMTFIDRLRSVEFEPNAATPQERIAAIREAQVLDIETWVSLEPVIDPAESLAVIDATHDVVDLFKIGKLNHRTSTVDWRAFGIEAIARCEAYGVAYYVKDDLAKHLVGVRYTSTDTRRVTPF